MKRTDGFSIDVAIIIAFGLFQFWPFALGFVTLGMVAALVNISFPPFEMFKWIAPIYD